MLHHTGRHLPFSVAVILTQAAGTAELTEVNKVGLHLILSALRSQLAVSHTTAISWIYQNWCIVAPSVIHTLIDMKHGF